MIINPARARSPCSIPPRRLLGLRRQGPFAEDVSAVYTNAATVRQHTHAGQSLPETISAEHLQDDGLLQPVIEDDGFIIELDDVLAEVTVSDPAPDADNEGDLAASNKQLKAALAEMEERFANYRLTVEETLNRRWGYNPDPSDNDEAKVDKSPWSGLDNGYWESYAGRGKRWPPERADEPEIPLTLLTRHSRDHVEGQGQDRRLQRLCLRKQARLQRQGCTRHRVWYRYERPLTTSTYSCLDIVSLLGILSMFCAKAGAKLVLAVDNSAIIDKARQNIIDNGLSDTITCIHGRIEDVELPVDKVDIIISEWMGYCLLYEAMLPSVLWARDKYLKPDGLLVPSVATIVAAPVTDDWYVTEHVSFWQDVYGFSMEAMRTGIYDEALVETLPEKALCGEPFQLVQLQLHDVRSEDLNFASKWSSKFTRDIDNLDGFLVWFDIFFTSSRSEAIEPASVTPAEWKKRDASRVGFTTGPYDTETHWKQGLLLAPPGKDNSPSSYKAGDALSGEASFSALQGDYRALSIDMSWNKPGGEERSSVWKLR
jgi:hypothetical protein